jgi:uncharacterized GH25 family protein
LRKFFISLLVMTALFMATPSQAHFLWLNIDNDQPEMGQSVPIEIGWGHKFPKDEVIKEGFLNQVYALDSKGTKIPLKQISPTEFEFVPTVEGIYTISANIHPGFLTKTTEGYRLTSKRGLKNAVSCFRFDIRAKAIVNAGCGEEVPEQGVGDPLEIIPHKNLRYVRGGEIFPITVLYNGKALPSANVRATYAGFSDKPNTFALTTMTDEEGVARIKILKKGKWLVNVMHEVPYPDHEECDKYRYNASFTFEVKL